jgi:hypothetical protein
LIPTKTHKEKVDWQRTAFPRKFPALKCAIATAAVAIVLSLCWGVRAQDTGKLIVDEDCQAFAASANGDIVVAVPRIKRVKRLYVERDDLFVTNGAGKPRKIVDAEKFMPFPPPAGYVINSLSWSPGGKRIAASMTLQAPPPDYEVTTGKNKGKSEDTQDDSPLSTIGGGRGIALFDDGGAEIKVAGSKTRFIQDGTNATWLADGATVVYMTGGPGQYSISRVRPSDGTTTALFDGHTFNALVWDAKRNRAFAVGDLSVHGLQTLLQLDLVHETVAEIARVDEYRGALSLSPSGKKIGFFADGDVIEVIDIGNPSNRLRVGAGIGRFEWSQDERRVLLQRGPEDHSNLLVWVGLYDGTFVPILHGLVFHDFEIMPDGMSIAVTDPGKRVLKIYPLE